MLGGGEEPSALAGVPQLRGALGEGPGLAARGGLLDWGRKAIDWGGGLMER